MNRETIAVDADDVLAAEREGIRLYINQHNGVSLTADDYAVEGPYWGYWEHVWQQDEETARSWFKDYLDSGVQASHPLVSGALEGIGKLQENYDLVVVTARQDHLFDITQAWLEQHFPSVFRDLVFVRLWSKDREATKAEICNELGAKYLIDDSVDHCNLAAEAGIQSLLFGDYGWNRNPEYLHPGIVRVAGWQSIREYFNGKAR